MAGACVVYHGAPNTPETLGAGLGAGERATVRWRPADELIADGSVTDEAAVLIVDGAVLERFGALRNIPEHVVIVAADVAAKTALGARADITIAGVDDPSARTSLLHAACRLAECRQENVCVRRHLARTDDEFAELCRSQRHSCMNAIGQSCSRSSSRLGRRSRRVTAAASCWSSATTRWHPAPSGCLQARFAPEPATAERPVSGW